MHCSHQEAQPTAVPHMTAASSHAPPCHPLCTLPCDPLPSSSMVTCQADTDHMYGVAIAFPRVSFHTSSHATLCHLPMHSLMHAPPLLHIPQCDLPMYPFVHSQCCNAESIMWPQVPQVYQTYRVWQLIRGCYIVGVLQGPDWLWALQANLLVLWVFNFGVVMSWTPWLYRWHLQPDSSQKSVAKTK